MIATIVVTTSPASDPIHETKVSIVGTQMIVILDVTVTTVALGAVAATVTAMLAMLVTCSRHVDCESAIPTAPVFFVLL